MGYKQLQLNPWENLEQKYPIGTKVTGLIRQIEDYGAFVEFEDGISGLLHNSELSWMNRNMSARDFFTVDNEVEVVILKIDAAKQKVRLSLKQLNPRWISMIESQTIMFITNGGRKQLSNVEVCESDVIGLDVNREESAFSIKQDILFAYSEKSHSKLLCNITQQITPQKLETQQLGVDDITLKSAQENRSIVTVIVRSGHELKGIIEGVDNNVIYMQINKQTVIVFRHCLCDFKIE